MEWCSALGQDLIPDVGDLFGFALVGVIDDEDAADAPKMT